jgi:hypothetical protein
MRCTGIAASQAIQMGRGMAVVDNQIPDIRYPGKCIGENKDGVAAIKKRVTEQ